MYTIRNRWPTQSEMDLVEKMDGFWIQWNAAPVVTHGRIAQRSFPVWEKNSSAEGKTFHALANGELIDFGGCNGK